MSVVISPSITPSDYTYPLTHARIGYDNFVPDATVTATSADTNYPADAVQRETTYEHWKPTSASNESLVFDQGASSVGAASYVGIAAHTLGTQNATIEIAHSDDNSTWTVIETLEPANNSAIMFIFAEVEVRYWRVRVVSADAAPEIGVVYIGSVLEMQRLIYGGHSPITLSRQTERRPTKSQKGQWLGVSIVRYGLQSSFNWRHLTAAWYRANFDPFVESARSKPFFIAWRPSKYPQEIAYGWLPPNTDIQPSNMGIRDLMEVSMTVEGYADE